MKRKMAFFLVLTGLLLGSQVSAARAQDAPEFCDTLSVAWLVLEERRAQMAAGFNIDMLVARTEEDVERLKILLAQYRNVEAAVARIQETADIFCDEVAAAAVAEATAGDATREDRDLARVPAVPERPQPTARARVPAVPERPQPTAEQAPRTDVVWTSSYGDIHWSEGWYGNSNKTLPSKSLSREEDGTYVMRGTWGRRNDPDHKGGFEFFFSGPCRFTGEWWYARSPDARSGWTGSCK